MRLAVIYNRLTEFGPAAVIEDVIKDAGIAYQHFKTEDARHIPKGFDIYFRIDHGDYKFDIPPDLHPAVFYAIDTHLPKPYKKILRQAGHYDIIFCAQKAGRDMLRRQAKVDCRWVPLAFDPRRTARVDTPKRFDIGFVGRDAEKFSRGRHLRLLKRKYPNSFIGEAPFDELSPIYGASRIGFNSSLNNDINLRIFEVMACGCFLLTNHITRSGLDELFTDRKHLVAYKSDRELLELIDYYLTHGDEREAIARAGYDLVMGRHTFYHRVQTMFNYIAFKFGGEFNSLRI